MEASLPFPSVTKAWHNSPYPAIDPRQPKLSTKGKSVFITGGGTGSGAAVARTFAAAGVTEMAITGRRKEVLDATAEALKKNFPELIVLTLATDVSKLESVEAAFDTFMKQFGKVDICVSNAGVAPPPVTFGSPTSIAGFV